MGYGRRAVAVVLLSAAPAAAQDIGGRCEVTGRNFDGSTCRGRAVIRAASDVTCEIEWNIGGQLSRAICMRQGDAFAAF